MLPVSAAEVFPTDSLLDHIPSLIVDISNYVKAPEEEAIAANAHVMEKARELGTLRHRQRASLHQVMREYQLLGGLLLRFSQDETIRLMLTPPPVECMSVVGRLQHAVDVLQQATVETFVCLYTETITAQSERLRQFTRMATHEWRQPLAPLMTAVSLLRRDDIGVTQRGQIIDLIDRNVCRLGDMTWKLERLARLDGQSDNASMQAVSVSVVAHEAARQLREMSTARGVELRVADHPASIVVDVGRLELALVNLISNAIKYCDPAKADRFVEVTSRLNAAGLIEIEVRDNGLGIAADRISEIFRRFTRAHTDGNHASFVDGLGLGLAIVDDCVAALRGTISVTSREGDGTTFTMTLPPGPDAWAEREPATNARSATDQPQATD